MKQKMKMRYDPIKLSGSNAKEFIMDLNSKSTINLDKNTIELFKSARKLIKKL